MDRAEDAMLNPIKKLLYAGVLELEPHSLFLKV